MVRLRAGAVCNLACGICCQGHGTPCLVVFLHAVAIVEDSLQPVLLAEQVLVLLGPIGEVFAAVRVIARAVLSDEVAQRGAYRYLGRFTAGIGYFVGQNGYGQAAVVCVTGDEGVESLYAHGNGYGTVSQVYLSEGVGGIERRLLEPGHAKVVGWSPLAVQIFIIVERACQHGGYRGLALRFYIDGNEGRVVAPRHGAEPLARYVHDFPVAQFAAATQRHSSCADATKRQGNFVQVAAVVMAQYGPLTGLPFIGRRSDGQEETEGKG